MTTALEDAAFLANSANRVRVLELLAQQPHHRDELRERLDVSRVTLARILRDLETRCWIERTGHECAVTPLGAWVSDEFGDLLETLSVEHRLRGVLPWLPLEHLSFDVRRLCDATIVVPTQNTISTHVDHHATYLRSAHRIRTLTYQIAPTLLEATNDAVTAADQHFEGVLTATLLETVLHDRTMAPTFLALLEEPSVTVYRYTESLPLSFFIADETVGLSLTDDENIARALVCSDDQDVHEWAVDTFERYRADANRVDTSSFTERTPNAP